MRFFENQLSLRWGFIIGIVIFIIGMVLVFFNLTREEKPEKIGFVILGDINEPGWNASHYNGIHTACEELGLKLLVRDKVPENKGECRIAVKELIREGAEMIYLCSYGYAAEIKDIVEANPQVSFATNSGEFHAKTLTCCFARLYQGRYLAGALAGMKTRSGVIGYVAALPNNEVCRGINAFTLGARRVRPDAKVVVYWTGAWENAEKEKTGARRLVKEAGADVLTYHQDDRAVPDAADEMGVDFIGYNTELTGYSEHHLTDVLCHWDVYYHIILQRFLKNELNSIQNFWMGIDRDAIYLGEFSPSVTPEMRNRLENLQQELVADKLIFSGPLYDNKGQLRCKSGAVVSDDTLLENMEWLIEGVQPLE